MGAVMKQREPHMRQCSFRSWLDDVDAELRAQGYPPTEDLFAGGWRVLWAASLTPAEAVPVGLQTQREAVSGFYHDSEEEEG